MSRESTLDEAIAKAKADGDRQLTEWLRMARGSESAARWYSSKLREAHRVERKLLDENAKLRELLSSTLGQVKEMCESNKDRCATCPLHHGNDECRMVMACDDARELGMEVD